MLEIYIIYIYFQLDLWSSLSNKSLTIAKWGRRTIAFLLF